MPKKEKEVKLALELEVEEEDSIGEVIEEVDECSDLSEDEHLTILNRFKKGEIPESELAQQFERLIYFVMHRYQMTHSNHLLLDESDCYNICLFRLFKCIKTYNPKKGKFTTYVVRAMMSGLIDEYKKNHRAKRHGSSISLDTFMVEENLADVLYYKYASIEFLPDLIFQEVKTNVVDIIQGLSAKEQSKHILIDLFIHQKRPKDISDQYGITPQAVTYVKKWFMPQLQFELQRRQLV